MQPRLVLAQAGLHGVETLGQVDRVLLLGLDGLVQDRGRGPGQQDGADQAGDQRDPAADQ